MSYDLTFARVIDAEAEDVFDAFTDPEGQEEFYGREDPGWIVESTAIYASAACGPWASDPTTSSSSWCARSRRPASSISVIAWD